MLLALPRRVTGYHLGCGLSWSHLRFVRPMGIPIAHVGGVKSRIERSSGSSPSGINPHRPRNLHISAAISSQLLHVISPGVRHCWIHTIASDSATALRLRALGDLRFDHYIPAWSWMAIPTIPSKYVGWHCLFVATCLHIYGERLRNDAVSALTTTICPRLIDLRAPRYFLFDMFPYPRRTSVEWDRITNDREYKHACTSPRIIRLEQSDRPFLSDCWKGVRAKVEVSRWREFCLPPSGARCSRSMIWRGHVELTAADRRC
ncbi:hypothetical protein A0H81_05995 [Grifola frondosa]|uniref:Uncharacterized protein n=1 Tax=Grifola frondosa TaxID=5627 RepID=A0A1C7M9R5_GRIFR|nr:hypothetical protein A0H81_05995 [Grifola frondosa]